MTNHNQTTYLETPAIRIEYFIKTTRNEYQIDTLKSLLGCIEKTIFCSLECLWFVFLFSNYFPIIFQLEYNLWG